MEKVTRAKRGLNMGKNRDVEISMFNIMVEAKTRALVIMTKKVHPEWDKAESVMFLHNAVDYAIQKES